MARPAEFNRRDVLRQSMVHFWHRGYHQTSMRDLTQATGLKSGSLYAAFDNKRSLFLEAMAQYEEDLIGQVSHRLRPDCPPLARIARFFDQLVDDITTDPDSKGCLLVNTLLEIHSTDPEILEYVQRALDNIEGMFAITLGEAIKDGDISQELDATRLAQVVMTGIYGLRIYARLHREATQLRSIANTIIDCIGATTYGHQQADQGEKRQ